MALTQSNSSETTAVDRLGDLFRRHGWDVDLEPAGQTFRPDLVASKGPLRYAVEVKSVTEGRPDRAIALLSQAILQARRHAKHGAMRPLAVIQAGHTSASLYRKLEQFQRDYSQGVAVGLMSEAGAMQFIGDPDLVSLNIEIPHGPSRKKGGQPRHASDLFSDLNQWMLKVLLAPELPEKLLNAPRGNYRTVSEMAAVAQVSVMSASRLVRRLHEEGFLDESQASFQLVRRRELFHRWQSSAMRSSPELRMSYVIPGAASRQLNKVAEGLNACIGMFAAADLLHLGHVSGVVPYLYVRRLRPTPKGWPGLVLAKPGEPAQVILKQASAPHSLFRGAVRVNDVLVSDALQIWLDASAHPSRGAEQADFLKHKVLAGIMGESE
jgi:hypothetical protein